MAANLIVTPDARQDTEAGHDWYENDRAGRGGYFLRRVGETIASICRTPNGFAVHCGVFRRAVVQKFPYIVVYRYDEGINTVFVHAVYHTSRDPNDLPSRLP